MKHTAPELLPCPFCGTKVSVAEHTVFNPETMKVEVVDHCWQIECRNCGCKRDAPEGFGFYSTKEEAIVTWNTRADLHEKRVKLLGELVEAFDIYGAHGDMCSWWGTPPLKNCDCGYIDLITRARQVGAR